MGCFFRWFSEQLKIRKSILYLGASKAGTQNSKVLSTADPVDQQRWTIDSKNSEQWMHLSLRSDLREIRDTFRMFIDVQQVSS